MKAIMYHYVRPNSGGMPYFRYLGLEDFRRQLDHFSKTYGFVTRKEFLDGFASGRLPEGVVLTFDDGLRDHYDYVLPELLDRGLWGIFYIPAGPYLTVKMLDVHRIHVLLGSVGSPDILAAMRELVSDENLCDADRDAFRDVTYARQDNDSATTLVKRTLNYYLSYEHRERVLDVLMREFLDDGSNLTGEFYLLTTQIRDLQEKGMMVGSHSVSHPVFSKLNEVQQQREIAESFDFLEAAAGGLPVRTFCYPYGGFHSFTAATERLLSDEKCLFSFNVEQRDVAASDVANRPQALPRYDCNQFIHGKARLGDTPERG